MSSGLSSSCSVLLVLSDADHRFSAKMDDRHRPRQWIAHSSEVQRPERGGTLVGGTDQIVDALAEMCGAERAQADLQQHAMDRLWRDGIAVAGRVGHLNGKAVVDVAEAEIRLVDFLGLKIVTQAARQAPILRQLDGAGGDSGLPARENPDIGLGIVVAVD